MLKDKGLTFDFAFTSVLSRAIKTLYYIQDTMALHWVPVVRDWRLNERHYGSLQGLNKAETAAKHGEEQVKVMSSYCYTNGRVSTLDNIQRKSEHITPLLRELHSSCLCTAHSGTLPCRRRQLLIGCTRPRPDR